MTAAVLAAGALGALAGACGGQSESNPGMGDTQPPAPTGTNPAIQEQLDTTPSEEGSGSGQSEAPGYGE